MSAGPDVSGRRPRDVYEKADWGFLTQRQVEGQWFERKAHPAGHPSKDLRTFRYEKVARPIVGFANSNPDTGGLLVIGIGDHGEVEGIGSFGLSYQNELMSVHDVLDGPVPQQKLVDVIRNDGASDQVIMIYTPFLPNRLASTTRHEVTVRRGDKTITLRPEEIQALAYEKGQLDFEDEPAIPFAVDALDAAVVAEFIEHFSQRTAEKLDLDRALRLARLMVTRDGQPWISKGGALVFHKDPCSIVPGAYVRYLRYEGADVDSTVQRDERFEGPLPTLIQKLRDFMPTQVARFSFRREGILVTEDEYPRAAWDEAIVNALVHRSYSQQTQRVRINQFPDRLEIISPGGYPLGVTPDNFIHTPRNTNLMEALRHLQFVRMAEEGTRAMRRGMRDLGLPAPQFSSPELTDRVECTLFNDIEKRTLERSGDASPEHRRPTSITANVFPLRISGPPKDPDDPFGGDEQPPGFREIRAALLSGLRQAGFQLDSFTSTVAVDFAQEYVIPLLRGKGLVSIYPGADFRLLELKGGYFLVVDHTVEVRNRANAARVKRGLPWIDLGNHRRRCFARIDSKWEPGFIAEDRGSSLIVELRERVGAGDEPQYLEATYDSVIPSLSAAVELPALLDAEGIRVNLTQEVRRVSLVGGDAARRRWDRIVELVGEIADRVFPLAVGSYEIRLSTAPVETGGGAVRPGRRLSEPKAQFDRQGRHQEDEVLHGLTTFGSLDKPETNLPLVLMSPARWISKLQDFVERLRLGQRPFRGMEATFGVRLGATTTIVAEPHEYERKALDAIAQVPDGQRPVFLVLSPQSQAGQVTYDSPYYRAKRLLLEQGFPSQMVNEDTISDPEWKDLNFALDVFAKAGYVPWVLSDGMPKADLFIGLSSSLISHGGQRSRLVGYANVFDEYGRWLYYQGAASAVPFEERNQMYAGILAEIVREYQAKRRKPQWVHVHHSAKLRREDRFEIARGIHSEAPEAEVSFVHINDHSAFRLFDTSPRGDGAAARGTWVTLTPNRFIVATTGPNPMRQRYLGTPRPVEVSVNRVGADERLDLSLYAQHVLSLTRLNWASTRSFCHTPITVKFANDIAHLMNVFHRAGDDFRLHPNLRGTPWFL